MKSGSCDDICRAEAAASTPHASQAWPFAFVISRLDHGIDTILHPLVAVGPCCGNFKCDITEVTDRRVMSVSGALWDKRWESRRRG